MKTTIHLRFLMSLLMLSAPIYTFASDVIVRGVNLGECTSYSDGCNTCTHSENGDACTMMACVWVGTPKCLDATGSNLEDTQIIDAVAAKNTKISFGVKTYNTCTDVNKAIKDFIISYYSRANFQPYWGPILYDGVRMNSMAESKSAISTSAPAAAVSKDMMVGSSSDVSTTNVQVLGVDESEIVKTDGTYIYYFNESDRAVYVVLAAQGQAMQTVKKIRLPETFFNAKLYLANGKLTILASRYDSANYGSRYWYYRWQKTVVIVYDVANPAALRLERLYSVDGSLGESRMIGSKLYMLSTNALSFPYDAYATMNALTSQKLNTAKVAADYNLSRVMPRKTDLYAADSASSANVRIGGKKYPYHVVASDVADCSSIDLVLPDASTLEKFDFTPSFTTLSIIDTSAPTKAVKTNLLFGNVGDVFMSQKNLYIAAPLYVSQNFVCPVGAMCALPYFPAGADTLIHKFSLDNSKASYKNTAIVPGDILNQYSMDEDGNGNFRIVTKNTYPKQESSVFIFDKSLSLVGALRGIGKDENFQSSRFIGDKLFLVTFQNIDPLFVIDLADQTRPRIIGELKMPGYSTYLHPYDPSRLIGLGYDTITNQWGGTQNGWLQVALYTIDYSAKESVESRCSALKNLSDVYAACVKEADPTRIRVEQTGKLTLGDQGSSSEALRNPRMFVWSAQKNLLFLPATLFTNAHDKDNAYRNKDVFQGLVSLQITPSGIQEKGRITHIDTKGIEEARLKECAQYSTTTKSACVKIIGGGEYCPPASTYVPTYCYADSTTGEYLANMIWNYSTAFIKRSVYIGNNLYTISDSEMRSSAIDNGYKVQSIIPMVPVNNRLGQMNNVIE